MVYAFVEATRCIIYLFKSSLTVGILVKNYITHDSTDKSPAIGESKQSNCIKRIASTHYHKALQAETASYALKILKCICIFCNKSKLYCFYI